MRCLWEFGPSSKRQLMDWLYPSATVSDAATVQKLIERLEQKGLVKRDRRRFAHIIHAAKTRDKFAGEQLEVLAEKLSDGSLCPLLLHVVETRRLTARERRTLRKLLEQEG